MRFRTCLSSRSENYCGWERPIPIPTPHVASVIESNIFIFVRKYHGLFQGKQLRKLLSVCLGSRAAEVCESIKDSRRLPGGMREGSIYVHNTAAVSSLFLNGCFLFLFSLCNLNQ